MSILESSGNKIGIVYSTICDRKDLIIGECTITYEKKDVIHYHDVPEIYIILEGDGEVLFKGEWVSAKKGDMFNIPEKTRHSARTTGMMKILYIFDKGPFNTIKYYFDNNEFG